MDKKWRIGAVSYLNTRPLLWGIEQEGFKNQINLVKSYPAKIAQDLMDGSIDIGLVPIAILPLLEQPHIISKYVIGTEGEVASVALFSQVPMNQIKRVYLDDHSTTSVKLLKILLAQFWKIEVEFLTAFEGYIDQINGTTAGLIIGDRALLNLSRFAFVFDLGLAWKQHTGLPFVFAAWVANKTIPLEFIQAFDTANAIGIHQIEHVISMIPEKEQVYNLYQYYTENISYHFTNEKKEGMDLFLKLI